MWMAARTGELGEEGADPSWSPSPFCLKKKKKMVLFVVFFKYIQLFIVIQIPPYTHFLFDSCH